ncbi:MAG: energy transducer TonB [Rhodospirillales bacterium]|nr:energy transducer TonB [Rhodospirillales bacterium]
MTQRSDIIRWSVSCATVLACYGAAATAILAWEPHYETPSAPLAIAMIDLAPLPPEPTPPPPAPPPPPEPEVIPEPPPDVKVEVPLPPVKKPPPPKVKREEPPPEPVVTPSPPIETAAVPAPTPAPRIAARPDPSPNIMALYSAQISAHVKKNLRYPLASLRRDERGTAHVILTLNREGRVLSYKLESGTNRRLLDEEAIAVVVRSNPMPPFPPEIDRNEMELRLPVVFTLR